MAGGSISELDRLTSLAIMVNTACDADARIVSPYARSLCEILQLTDCLPLNKKTAKPCPVCGHMYNTN